MPHRRQHLGKNSFTRLINEICTTANFRGNVVHDYMTTHGLRATMTSLLIEAGHNYSIIVLRTGLSSTDTLTRYHNLQGNEGFRQQISLFGTKGARYISRTGNSEKIVTPSPKNSKKIINRRHCMFERGYCERRLLMTF